MVNKVEITQLSLHEIFETYMMKILSQLNFICSAQLFLTFQE